MHTDKSTIRSLSVELRMTASDSLFLTAVPVHRRLQALHRPPHPTLEMTMTTTMTTITTDVHVEIDPGVDSSDGSTFTEKLPAI